MAAYTVQVRETPRGRWLPLYHGETNFLLVAKSRMERAADEFPAARVVDQRGKVVLKARR
jgi:hypothetical protein